MSLGFVVDANLPAALARAIAAKGYLAIHVSDLEMETSDDPEIAAYAIANDLFVITKDNDFVKLQAVKTPAPKVIWIRVGNTRKAELLAWFLPVLPEIEALYTANPLVTLIEVQRHDTIPTQP